jgi:hypothetical protein
MASVCRARWRLQENIRFTILRSSPYEFIAEQRSPKELRIEIREENFHMESKRKAEELATTPIYVVADDDCLILGKDFIEQGIAFMNEQMEVGMIGAWNVIDDHGLSQTAVLVNKDPGGIIFVRKGILTEFNDLGADHTDESLSLEMKRKGYRVGVTPQARFNHLGSGYSLTSKGVWSA